MERHRLTARRFHRASRCCHRLEVQKERNYRRSEVLKASAKNSWAAVLHTGRSSIDNDSLYEKETDYDNEYEALFGLVGLHNCITLIGLTYLPHSAETIDEKWKADMIADALRAAPPSVTHNAAIYAWSAEGDMIMVRHGVGPYTCVASGMLSLRLGKPPLPYPDPMCMDQNAWAFFQAVWAEKNPLKLEKPYPTAPGLAWMLAGMSIKKGAVALGKGATSAFKATKGQAGGEMFQMTPHIMIMPVPFDKNATQLPTNYDLKNPLHAWIMAAGTPIEHLMLHFSDDEVKGMMEAGQ